MDNKTPTDLYARVGVGNLHQLYKNTKKHDTFREGEGYKKEAPM